MYNDNFIGDNGIYIYIYMMTPIGDPGFWNATIILSI